MSDQGGPTPTDVIARKCIAVRLRLLNRVVTNLYDDALRPLGLKVSQMNILVVAAKLGLARYAEVCEILQLDTSTLSRNVERMRQQGWLHERPGPDGRAVLLATTARGRALLIRAMPLWEDAQEQVCKLLGESGAASVARLAQPFFPPGNKR